MITGETKVEIEGKNIEKAKEYGYLEHILRIWRNNQTIELARRIGR